MTRRRAILAAILTATTLGVVGWAVAYAWLPRHVLAKTGRTHVPAEMCAYCHLDKSPPLRADAVEGPRYVSPAGLAVSPDGVKLFVAASEADRLLVLDARSGRLTGSVDVPGAPHGVAVSADGRRLAVSSRHGDRVRLLDASTLETLSEVEATEPLGLSLTSDGAGVLVAEAFSDSVVVRDLAPGGSEVRLVAGNQPYALALSADGRLAVVANRLVRPEPPGVVAASELTLIDPVRGRVLERRELESAHLAEGVALSRDASFALVPVVRFRNLLPLTQVVRGAVMSSALAFVETRPGGRTVQFPLDEVNAYFADPSGIALSRDERLCFVAHAGARVISVVDVERLRRIVSTVDATALAELADDLGASADYVVARVPTSHTPRALALSPDGRRLYVAEHFADSIAVIDTHELTLVDRFDLGGPRRLTDERRGALVFHDASVTFQGQFSCRSCHPDGQADALIWDFEIDGVGRNLVDTRSLLGIRHTRPFKWNGKNPDLATQCGPRFARVLTRSDPFPPDRLGDLVSYIESLPVPPRRVPAEWVEAAERGRTIFHRTVDNRGEPIPLLNRCDTCHRPPLFTDRLKADVGTGGSFDTPHLFDVGATAPYLHDGRSLTLEEIWTVHSPEDTHGATNDLTKAELNDLVIYLRSL
jgi:DNA-binding beta-propeller fold protein YncE